MFSLHSQVELRLMTVSSLITCIYLPIIVTFISYNGTLYSIGKGSSFYVLVLIFVAEMLKSFYFNTANHIHGRNVRASKNTADIIRSFLFLLGVTFCYFVGIILLGAPVEDCHEETLMLSALLVLLTVFPMIAHSGIEPSMQMMFGVKNVGEDTIIGMIVDNALLTICGAWLGAIVIPLDWNMPWQKWPVPCCLGAIGGYLLSNVLTVIKVTVMIAANKFPILTVPAKFLSKLQIFRAQAAPHND